MFEARTAKGYVSLTPFNIQTTQTGRSRFSQTGRCYRTRVGRQWVDQTVPLGDFSPPSQASWHPFFSSFARRCDAAHPGPAADSGITSCLSQFHVDVALPFRSSRKCVAFFLLKPLCVYPYIILNSSKAYHFDAEHPLFPRPVTRCQADVNPRPGKEGIPWALPFCLPARPAVRLLTSLSIPARPFSRPPTPSKSNPCRALSALCRTLRSQDVFQRKFLPPPGSKHTTARISSFSFRKMFFQAFKPLTWARKLSEPLQNNKIFQLRGAPVAFRET